MLGRNASWVPLDRARAQMSKGYWYVLLVVDGQLLSLEVERLLDLIAGHVESMRVFKLEEHRE